MTTNDMAFGKQEWNMAEHTSTPTEQTNTEAFVIL
jgi:hypothetical protein